MKFLIEKHRITKQAFEKVKEVVVTLYAHTDDSNDGLACQRLEDHLSAVSEMASSFAERFGMGSWGRALGILHDAGKSSEAFQRRLQGSDQHVDILLLARELLSIAMGNTVLAVCWRMRLPDIMEDNRTASPARRAPDPL